MKQEPVAYQWDYVASSEGDGFIKITMPIEKWNELIDIVDYTAPKQLSDEEIKNCLIEWAKIEHGDEYLEPTSKQLEPLMKMSRAILKKASEK